MGATEDPGRVSIRVATLNLFGVRADWPSRRDVVRAGLADLNPDLVSLEEAIVTSDYDQARDVLGEEYHFAHHSVRLADGQGDSIASRWPFTTVSELDVPARTPAATAPLSSTLLARIDLPAPTGAVLLVANHARIRARSRSRARIPSRQHRDEARTAGYGA